MQRESLPPNKGMDLPPCNFECFVNRYVYFSIFSIIGQILHEVLQEMKIRGIKIKEILCWKFLLTSR